MAETTNHKRAVVLLSGGVDSSTTLAIARDGGAETYALSIDYGQRNALELDAARAVAAGLGAKRHLVLTCDLSPLGGSALTGELEVPKGGTAEGEIPVTYVPARNTVFLSLALGWAEVLGAGEIYIGANAVDYSGYPDCRPEFIAAYERMANLATKAAVEENHPIRIMAPLIKMSKAEIILAGLRLGLDYALTWSCYDPTSGGRPCGGCDSCRIRARGFEEAGLPDPLLSP